jgi:tetratricopeptide (TPR) repeat protein
MTFFTLLFALVLAVFELAVPAQAQRLDLAVRSDFFAGFSGDDARLQKAMALCESILTEHPRHPEALVWHGAGLLFQAGRSFQTGDTEKGLQLFQSGMSRMNEAVTLEPDNVAVLIPRGAVLLTATRSMDPATARPLLEQAVSDYEKVLAIQASYFDTLGDHPRGELLFGLADGSARLGRIDQARRYFERIVTEVPASGQSERAREWLNTGVPLKVAGMGCIGCHKK